MVQRCAVNHNHKRWVNHTWHALAGMRMFQRACASGHALAETCCMFINQKYTLCFVYNLVILTPGVRVSTSCRIWLWSCLKFQNWSHIFTQHIGHLQVSSMVQSHSRTVTRRVTAAEMNSTRNITTYLCIEIDYLPRVAQCVTRTKLAISLLSYTVRLVPN